MSKRGDENGRKPTRGFINRICKVFKKQTGESLIACFNRMKAQRAAKLLRETAKPVTDIAAELGFKETKYFDTVFKKFHGISPVRYREEAEKHRN